VSRGESVQALPGLASFFDTNMKSINAAREAATTKKNQAQAESRHFARVGIKAAESIADIAERFEVPPALIAGTIASLGCAIIRGLGKGVHACSIQSLESLVIGSSRSVKSAVPVLVRDRVRESCEQYAQRLNRPFEILMGQMIEIGLPYWAKEGALGVCDVTPGAAFFYSMSYLIKEENTSPEALELLKPAAQAPPAFVAFESILAEKGGAA
jgi:hypothetical protein